MEGFRSRFKPAPRPDANRAWELAGAQEWCRDAKGRLPCTGSVWGNTRTVVRAFVQFRDAYLALSKKVTVPNMHPIEPLAVMERKLLADGYPIQSAGNQYPEYVALVAKT